jgi:antitoxin MazE
VKTHIKKWGNSLAIRIPKALAEEAGLESDTSVEITLERGCIVITPKHLKRYTLEELISQITDDNIHGEVW